MNDRDISELYRNGIRTPDSSSDLVCQVLNDDWEAIDWDDPELPEDVRWAHAEMASELHYVYTKQLTLLGDIISNAPDMDMKRLATVLSSSHMRSVDAWSRFFVHTGRNANITEKMEEHLLDIEEDDACCQLATVVCTGVFTAAVHRHLEYEEDTVFERLLYRDAQQGAKNCELTARYMQRWMDTLDDERRDAVTARLEDCINFMDDYVNTFRDIMDAAQVDADKVIDDYRRNVQRFSKRIRDDLEHPLEDAERPT